MKDINGANGHQAHIGDHLYQEVARGVAHAIEGGALQLGQKVPSVQHLSTQEGVSVSTVLQAYRSLENGDYIEVCPQSGDFRRRRAPAPPEPEAPRGTCGAATEISTCALVGQVLRATSDPHLQTLGRLAKKQLSA